MLKMEFANKHVHQMVRYLGQSFCKHINNLKLHISCCCLCGNPCQQHPLLCQYCQADLPYFDHQRVPYDLLLWPAIAKIIPINRFDHLLAIAPYVWPFDTWIGQLKYQHKTELAALLSYLLITHWRQYLEIENVNLTSENTMILAVPLHIKKWQERGFNQAHLIARKFAQHFNYNYQTNIIVREKLTENQVGKSGAERRKNLKNAFSIQFNKQFPMPTQVVLIDDVVTTGTTANEICRLLKKKGVQNITLLSLCLALPGKS
jgi:ComF family protein